MGVLVENPMPVVFCGIVVEAILGAIFLNNRRVIMLAAMAGVLVLVLVGVAVEWMIVTPREEVETTLDGLAAALEANDRTATLGYLSPSATQTRGRAQWALDRFDVGKAKVSSLKIVINELTNPPSARASFNGSLGLKDRRGEYPPNTYTIGFTVEFRKEGDCWLLVNHTESMPGLIGPRPVHDDRH